MALAHELALKAPLAVQGIMQAVIEGGELPTMQGIEIEYQAQRRSAGSEDMIEGVKAFFEKRPAVFKGR
jgi:enoyl-CoA hydratase